MTETPETREPMLTHFAGIQRRWPAASLTTEADGSHIIVVPGVPVEGYDVPEVTVSFAVSSAFPLACPSDFTTGPTRLAHGSLPSHTKLAADGERLLWVHRLLYWDPQRDSLINYMGDYPLTASKKHGRLSCPQQEFCRE